MLKPTKLPSHWLVKVRLIELFLGLTLLVFGLSLLFGLGYTETQHRFVYNQAQVFAIDSKALGILFLLNGLFSAVVPWLHGDHHIIRWVSNLIMVSGYMSLALIVSNEGSQTALIVMTMLVLKAMYCLTVNSYKLLLRILP